MQAPEIHVTRKRIPQLDVGRGNFFFSSLNPSAHKIGRIVGAEHGMEDWGMYDSQAHMYARQYFHSQTCLPITTAQLECDSDDDIDETWITESDERLLDEFDDVNPHEKLFMKLWNRHVRSHPIYADKYMASACKALVSRFWRFLSDNNLRSNLLLHLINLWDNCVIHSMVIADCMQLFDNLVAGKINADEVSSPEWRRSDSESLVRGLQLRARKTGNQTMADLGLV